MEDAGGSEEIDVGAGASEGRCSMEKRDERDTREGKERRVVDTKSDERNGGARWRTKCLH